jgi:hypothetical protein
MLKNVILQLFKVEEPTTTYRLESAVKQAFAERWGVCGDISNIKLFI